MINFERRSRISLDKGNVRKLKKSGKCENGKKLKSRLAEGGHTISKNLKPLPRAAREFHSTLV